VNLRILFASLSMIAVVGGLGVFRAQADSWDKKTTLTIREPIQVRDRLLEPGTYVFKLLNSSSDRHVVQIFNEDQSHIVDTILAIPNYRLEPTGDSRFRFWETPPGQAKALRAWFYPGDNFGQEFPYPKHPATIEIASATTLTRTPEPVTTAPAQPTQAAEPTPAPAAVEQPRPVEQAPAPPSEIARNATPEPAAPMAEPTQDPPQAAPAPASQTLPKTASTYPLAGLIGVCCLLAFGLVRDKGVRARR
jgi:hypothetical protein